MNPSQIVKNPKVWAGVIIFIILLAFVIWMFYPRSENLTTTFAIENVYPDYPIKPMVHDPKTGVIMAGSETDQKKLLSPWYDAYFTTKSKQYLLNDGADGAMGLQFDRCSKSCCSSQYPLPFDMPNDEGVCENKSKYVPNQYTCNNQWQDSGCVCMTKKQADFIAARGGNAV